MTDTASRSVSDSLPPALSLRGARAALAISAVKLWVTVINAGDHRAHWAKRRLYRTEVPAWLSGQNLSLWLRKVPARLGAKTSMEEDKKISGQYESGSRECWHEV